MMTTDTQIRTPFRQLMRVGAAAVLALGLAACGGSSNNKPTGNGGGSGGATQMTAKKLAEAATNALNEAETAVNAVKNDSTDTTVTEADEKLAAALEAVGKASGASNHAVRSNRLGELQGTLKAAKKSRMTAMSAKANMRKQEALAVYVGIAPYSDVTDNVARRYAVWGDQGIDIAADSTVNVSVGEADAENLKLDKATTVEARGGWKGARYKLEDEGTTYEAVVYNNAYSQPGDKFSNAWKDDIEREGTFDGWLKKTATASASNIVITDDSVNLVAGINLLGDVGESVRLKGTLNGVAGIYLCTPAAERACAGRPTADGLLPGGSTKSLQFASASATSAEWRFKPDDPEDRIKGDPDTAFVTYGYWIREGADGKWDVSAFHNAYRGPLPTFQGLDGDDNLYGKVTYEGGAAGVYTLSAEAGKFTADAELVADFTANTVTGTIDGFKTTDFDGNNSMDQTGWSVELHKLAVGDGGGMGPDTSTGSTGLTRWTMNGTAVPAAGKWEGAFYDRGGAGLRPKAATGSFYAVHDMSGKMVGAFGVQDPNRDEQ